MMDDEGPLALRHGKCGARHLNRTEGWLSLVLDPYERVVKSTTSDRAGDEQLGRIKLVASRTWARRLRYSGCDISRAYFKAEVDHGPACDVFRIQNVVIGQQYVFAHQESCSGPGAVSATKVSPRGRDLADSASL